MEMYKGRKEGKIKRRNQGENCKKSATFKISHLRRSKPIDDIVNIKIRNSESEIFTRAFGVL